MPIMLADVVLFCACARIAVLDYRFPVRFTWQISYFISPLCAHLPATLHKRELHLGGRGIASAAAPPRQP
jgi:hypothetical protein